jgi:hypothetical protein
MTVELLSANHGAAHAATMAARANRTGRGFCSGVYPITPSTECMEYLCLQEIEKGRVIRVESEHSAMGRLHRRRRSRRADLHRHGLQRPGLHGRKLHRRRRPAAAGGDGGRQSHAGPAVEYLGRPGRCIAAARPGPDPVLLRRQPGGIRQHPVRLPPGGGRSSDDAGNGLHGGFHPLAHHGQDRHPRAGTG